MSRLNPGNGKKPAIQSVLNTPTGQTPCIAGFLNRQNKRIDHSIESMLWSIRDELGLYLWHNFIFPPQGYSRVFKSSKAQYSQEFLLFTILRYLYLTGRWYNGFKAVDWAIFRKSLPLGAKTALCRLHSTTDQIRRWWVKLLNQYIYAERTEQGDRLQTFRTVCKWFKFGRKSLFLVLLECE